MSALVEAVPESTQVTCPVCDRRVVLMPSAGEPPTGRCHCGRMLVLIDDQDEGGRPVKQVQIRTRPGRPGAGRL